MSLEKVVLARHKRTDYVVNHENRRYVWAGSRGNVISRKEVPMEVYDYLLMFTTTFKNGELVVEMPEKAATEELEEVIPELEEYKVNGLSKETVIKLLNGNFKKMTSELEKVTSDSTKRFVYEVAKEIELESSAKQKFIKEWLGTQLTIEELFLGE